MVNVIKFDQLSPFQKRIWEAVEGYPEVEMHDLVTLLDSTKTIVKTGVYRLLALGYLTRLMKERAGNNRGRKSVYVYTIRQQSDALRHQKEIGGIPKRGPRPSELAKRMQIVERIGTSPDHVRIKPAPMQTENEELVTLRRWKAFAIKLYPQLNQPDEIFDARELLMRQYSSDAKQRDEIMGGKHDHGPAMKAIIEALSRTN